MAEQWCISAPSSRSSRAKRRAISGATRARDHRLQPSTNCEKLSDEFNRRCRRAANRIRDRLKTKGDLITGVFLHLNSYEELPATEDYQAILHVTALPETCEDLQEEQIALSLFAAIERALNDCSGVQVVDGSLVAETEISLYDLRLGTCV